MCYYGGYTGQNSSCGYNQPTYTQSYAYPMYSYYNTGNGMNSNAAIVLVLFILLVIILGTRLYDNN